MEGLVVEQIDSQSAVVALAEADSSVADTRFVAVALAEADRLVGRGKP